MNRNISTFISCESEYIDADIVLFGAPFDGTTSFKPGTRFGPKAIRDDSFAIETYSPYQDKDLTELHIFDAGDIEFPFGNTEAVLNQITKLTMQIISDGKLPIMLGGEHLVTLGAARAITQTYSDVTFLHFDAHTDLRDDYLGEKLSHATVMRRVWELVGDNNIYQFGIRSGERAEFQWAETHTKINKFNCDTIDSVIKELKGKNVYITIDLDILDPSIFSGTGTPEAGGIQFLELLDCIMKFKGLNIIGADITELSPSHDMSGVSTAVACKVLRELLLVL